MDLGISIQLDSSKSVRVNGRKLFSSFLSLCANILEQVRKLATQGTPINFFSLASSGIALTESITLEDTLEGQLSSLIQKGYQLAVLDMLKQYEEYFEIKEDSWEVSGIFEEFETQMIGLMEREIKIDNTFFSNFYGNDVICTVSDSFAKYIGLFCGINSKQISRTFKYGFLKWIVMEYCRHVKKYNMIPLLAQNPFQPSVEQAIDWTIYRQTLIDLIPSITSGLS